MGKKRSADDSIEQPDVQSARSRLKGALQDIVEPTSEESSSDESSNSKLDPIPLRGRPKKQKLQEMPQQQQQPPQPSFIMKLFDRSVDLAKFKEGSPLYPICRAWMMNKPRGGRYLRKRSSELIPRNSLENIVEQIKDGTVKDVTEMPCENDTGISRVPSPLPFQMNKSIKIDLNYELDDPEKNRTVLLSEHHNRWIQVRRKWLDQTNLYRNRYETSIKLLDAIYKPIEFQ